MWKRWNIIGGGEVELTYNSHFAWCLMILFYMADYISELYLDQNAVLSACKYNPFLLPIHRQSVDVVAAAQLTRAHLFSTDLEANQGFQLCYFCIIR